MARENGTTEGILDTRPELHILEYNLRMATIAKDVIANYTHYLIKIALLPNSRYEEEPTVIGLCCCCEPVICLPFYHDVFVLAFVSVVKSGWQRFANLKQKQLVTGRQV